MKRINFNTAFWSGYKHGLKYRGKRISKLILQGFNAEYIAGFRYGKSGR